MTATHRAEPVPPTGTVTFLFTDIEGSAYQIALVYGYRGEANLAFEWLEREYEQRDSGLIAMKVSTLLKNLHGDPRWLPFLEKMGLAD